MAAHDPLIGRRALEQARRTRTSKPPDQRRREILTAATHLFREHGYDATSVQAIATRADVAAGTVYLYFSSKAAILSALEEDFEAGLLESLGAAAAEILSDEDTTGDIVSYQEAVDRLIDGMLNYSLANRPTVEVLARHTAGRTGLVPAGPILTGALTETLARIIREAIRLGYVSTSDPEMTAYLLTLAVTTAIGNALAFEDEVMLARVVQQAKELYIKALAPDPQPVERHET